VTSLGLGDDFVIALGLTLPQKEYEKLARTNGILRPNFNVIAQENKVPEH
jgi:hypothetical protein